MKAPCGHLSQEVLPGARPVVLNPGIPRLQRCSGGRFEESGLMNSLDLEAAMMDWGSGFSPGGSRLGRNK